VLRLAGSSKVEKLHGEARIRKAAATITSKTVADLIIDELHQVEKDEEKAKKNKAPTP
jgi:hypothetical protein